MVLYTSVMISDFSKYTADCIKFLQELIRTPSVNGTDSEKDVVNTILAEAKRLNLPCRIISKDPSHPNIFIGQDFKSDQQVLLVAHSDTVGIGDRSKWEDDPFSGLIKDNKLFGRGAIDCKGGIALNLYTLKILSDLGRPDLAKAVAVSDEESGGDSKLGLNHLLSEGLNSKAAIYTYGGSSGHDSLNIGHRGLVRLWVTCHGESSHSGSKEWQERQKGSSAIEGILSFLSKLNSLSFTKTNNYFPGYKTLITPTLIEGGEGESLVPGVAKVLLDIRLLPDDSNDDTIKKIVKLTQELTQPKLKYKIEIKNNVSSALSDPNSRFIENLSKLNKEIYGVVPVIKGSGPVNESHMLINKGIPTVAGFGPSGDNFHSQNEYAHLDSIEESLRFLTKAILSF